MERAWLFLIVLVLLCAPAYSQSSGVVANADAVAVQDIKALEERLCRLLVDRRYHEYALFVADDYVGTSASGDVETKQQVLENFKDQKDTLISMVPDDMKVRVYGDAAILTLRLSLQVQSGKGVEARFSRVTKTFVRRNGRWYLASMAGTAVPE